MGTLPIHSFFLSPLGLWSRQLKVIAESVWFFWRFCVMSLLFGVNSHCSLDFCRSIDWNLALIASILLLASLNSFALLFVFGFDLICHSWDSLVGVLYVDSNLPSRALTAYKDYHAKIVFLRMATWDSVALFFRLGFLNDTIQKEVKNAG